MHELHVLFDKHRQQQSELVDAIAERIQMLGGVSLAMAHDIAKTTLIPRGHGTAHRLSASGNGPAIRGRTGI